MMYKTEPNQSTALIGQLARLKIISEQILRSLSEQPQYLPGMLRGNLAQLLGQLNQVSKLVEQQEDERENLKALVEIGAAINSSLDLNDVLQMVMDTIVRLIQAERGFLMLSEGGGALETRIARNWEQESIDPSEFAISRTIIQRVINDAAPVLTTNAQEDPRFGGQESIVFFNLRSILCVPLIHKGEVTGVIYADNRIRSGIFTERELNLLTAYSNQAAVAIENARLFESVQQTLAEVTELKNLVDNIFTSMPSGVLTTDAEERITMCNRAAEEIIGCRREDVIGNPLENVLPTIAPRLSRYLKRVWNREANVIDLEFNFDLPCRGPVSLSLSLSPLKDAADLTQGVAIVIDDLTEKKSLEAQRRLFERMVSPAVIDQLDPNRLQLGGKRATITTLFADIRGFTGFSEQTDPENLVAVLNQYLSIAAEAVLANEGTIDKFLGDAIMAWFNAPIPQPDHTLRAVRTALDIQRAIAGLQEELPQSAKFSFGVGIHVGEAVLGLIGNEKRLEYTAIGDSVNTAKRIQEHTAGGQVLISAQAYSYVHNDVRVKPVYNVLAKGKSQPIPVYEVLEMM